MPEVRSERSYGDLVLTTREVAHEVADAAERVKFGDHCFDPKWGVPITLDDGVIAVAASNGTWRYAVDWHDERLGVYYASLIGVDPPPMLVTQRVLSGEQRSDLARAVSEALARLARATNLRI